jgi:hypothetical protein
MMALENMRKFRNQDVAGLYRLSQAATPEWSMAIQNGARQ